MKKIDDFPELKASRKRLAELRVKRKDSVADLIERRRSTILINMIISIISGAIFAVGLYFVIRFLNMQKSQMNPVQYKIYMGVFTVISIGWFVYLFMKIRSYCKLLRKNFSP